MRRLLGLVAALVVAILIAAAPAQATFPGKNGRITFGAPPADPGSSWFDTYTIRPDGTGLAKLITNGGMARWSPDGKTVVFRSGDYHSDGHPDSDLYIAAADGSDIRPLPSPGDNIISILWSPDGKKIAFATDTYRVSLDNYIVNADGTGLVRLSEGHIAAWSPDGRQIALWVAGGGLSLVNAYGRVESLLPSGSEPDWFKRLLGYSARSWSPDGSKVIVPEAEARAYVALAILRRDGSEFGRITLEPGHVLSSSAVWSPDSTQIAYVDLDYDGTFTEDVYLANADGTGKRNLTNAPGFYDVFDWQPIPGPRRSDYRNSAGFCKAERGFWGDQFPSRYGGGANAFGKCVSGK